MASNPAISSIVNQHSLSTVGRVLLDVVPELTIAKSSMAVAARQLAMHLVRKSLVFFIMTWVVTSIGISMLTTLLSEQTAAIVIGNLARSMPQSEYVYHLMNTTHSGYQYAGLDNAVCKKYMACRAGEYIAMEHAPLVSWMKRTSILDNLVYYGNRTDDKYVKITLSMLESDIDSDLRETCNQQYESCEAWIRYEKMLGIEQPEPKLNEDGTTAIPPVVNPKNRPSFFNLFL